MLPPSGDVAVVIPARNESDRIGATVTSRGRPPGSGSGHRRRRRLGRRHGRGWRGTRAPRCCGTRATGARPRRWRPAPRPSGCWTARPAPRWAGQHGAPASPAVPGRRPGRVRGRGRRRSTEPVRAGQADMTIAVFSSRVKPGRARFRGRACPARHRAGHRVAPRPAAERAALPDPRRVRDRPAARARFGCGDGAHHRPAPPGDAGRPRSRCRSRTGPPGATGRPSCTAPASSPTSPGRSRPCGSRRCPLRPAPSGRVSRAARRWHRAAPAAAGLPRRTRRAGGPRRHRGQRPADLHRRGRWARR